MNATDAPGAEPPTRDNARSMGVAIMGLPRCGTTLLSDLLSIQSRSVILSEPNIHGRWSQNTIQRIHTLLANAGVPVSPTAPQQTEVGDFARHFAANLYPALNRFDLWGVKYVDLFAWWNLFRDYPPKHLILSVRDLRDVAVSSLDRIARLTLAFADLKHMRDEAWVLSSLGHNIHELLRLADRADRIVRYEDFAADPALRGDIAALVGVGRTETDATAGRANIEASQRRRDWELAKHGDAITTASVARHTAEPPGPIRALSDRIWRLYATYSERFGYDVPPAAARIAGHPFTMLAPMGLRDENPVAYRNAERWDWEGPPLLEPAFARRRARIRAAQFVPRGSIVLDLSCGVPALRYLLPPECRFIMCDVVARNEKYRVARLCEGELPDKGRATLVAALGLLEHVDPDLPSWLRRLREYGLPAIVSYHPADDTADTDRAALGWVNHLTRAELQGAAEAAGFAVEADWAFDGRQAMLRLSPR
ncbi:MAG: sulfotransferase [Rhodospirillaceae bacterium]|nr:sulfotransferase [Rhodospirillaceae bacterium]